MKYLLVALLLACGIPPIKPNDRRPSSSPAPTAAESIFKQ